MIYCGGQPNPDALSVAGWRRAGSTRGARGRSRRARSGIGCSRSSCGLRSTPVDSVRQPADSRRPARAGRARQPQASDSVDAGGGPEGARPETVHVHDHQRSRVTGLCLANTASGKIHFTLARWPAIGTRCVTSSGWSLRSGSPCRRVETSFSRSLPSAAPKTPHFNTSNLNPLEPSPLPTSLATADPEMSRTIMPARHLIVTGDTNPLARDLFLENS